MNEKISQYLALNKITQKELSIRTGISHQTMSNILKSNDLKISQLKKICEALELPLTFFFETDEVITTHKATQIKKENFEEENKELRKENSRLKDEIIALLKEKNQK